jgi:hypothetical protein
VAFDKTPEQFMSKKTYFILQRIEADGQVFEPAHPDAPKVTAQLSDEAAASLLPLGVIAGVIAELPAGVGKLPPAEAKAAAAPAAKLAVKDAS